MKTLRKIRMAMFAIATIGMTVACQKSDNTDDGNGDINASIVGTWNVVGAYDGDMMIPGIENMNLSLVMNENGTGAAHSAQINHSFNWALDGTTLNITSTATSQGFLRATVTATAGEVSISRDFVAYINGTKDGIQPIQLKEARVQSYQLYNTAGILINQGNGYGVTPSQLNLQDVPSGVYLMKIVDQDGRTRSYSVLKR